MRAPILVLTLAVLACSGRLSPAAPEVPAAPDAGPLAPVAPAIGACTVTPEAGGPFETFSFTAPAGMAGFDWRFVVSPPDALVGLADGATTSATVLPVVGRYQAEVRGGGETARCEVEVRPVAGFSAQLTWARASGDLDLSMARLEGELEEPCSFANCLPGAEQPEWGPPTLLNDDGCGYGPEFIEVDALPAGEYRVEVEHFGFTACPGVGPSPATLAIVFRGEVLTRLYRTLEPGERWAAALVSVDQNGHICVRDLDTEVVRCEGEAAPLEEACATQADCGPLACYPSSSSCIELECDAARPCLDSREACDDQSGLCVLPAAECAESDEPNDDVEGALALDETYSGVLCRGDVDVHRIEAQANQRTSITLDVAGAIEAREGLRVSLTSSDGSVLAARELDVLSDLVTLTLVHEGAIFAHVDGAGVLADSWDYSLSVSFTEIEAVDCEGELASEVEPNDQPEDAHPLSEGGAFFRCGLDDVDWYRIEAEPQSGVHIELTHALADGDLDLELFDIDNPEVPIAAHKSTEIPAQLDGDEGPSAYLLKVRLFAGPTSLTDQAYSLSVTTVPRPAACDADPFEPNPDPPPALADLSAIHCGDIDLDQFTAAVPAQTLTTVTIVGGPSLELLSDTGAVIATGTTLGLPVSEAAAEHTVRVRGQTDTIEPYDLTTVETPAAACFTTEATPNETLQSGTPTTAPASTNGHICGPRDVDWINLGPIATGQSIRATLTQDPADAVLGLAIGKLSPGGNDLIIAREQNQDAAPNIELRTRITDATTAHGVRVITESGANIAPYTLDVTLICAPDAKEDETKATATTITRPDTAPFTTTLTDTACDDDRDVYSLIVLPGETLTATLTGPGTLTIEDETTTLATGNPATTTPTDLKELFITVAADPNATTANYTLELTTTP